MYIERKKNIQFHQKNLTNKMISAITELKKILSMCLTFSNTAENKDFYFIGIYPYFLHKIKGFYSNFSVLLENNLLVIENYSKLRIFYRNNSWYQTLIHDLSDIKDLNHAIIIDINGRNRYLSHKLIPNIENYVFQFNNIEFLAIGDNIFSDDELQNFNTEFSECFENTKMLLIEYKKKLNSVNISIKDNINSLHSNLNLKDELKEILDNISCDNSSTIQKLEIFLSDMSNLQNLKDLTFSLYDVKSNEYQSNCEHGCENTKSLQDLISELESMSEIINGKKFKEKFIKNKKTEFENSKKKVIESLDQFCEFISIIKYIPNENKKIQKKKIKTINQ